MTHINSDTIRFVTCITQDLEGDIISVNTIMRETVLGTIIRETWTASAMNKAQKSNELRFVIQATYPIIDLVKTFPGDPGVISTDIKTEFINKLRITIPDKNIRTKIPHCNNKYPNNTA